MNTSGLICLDSSQKLGGTKKCLSTTTDSSSTYEEEVISGSEYTIEELPRFQEINREPSTPRTDDQSLSPSPSPSPPPPPPKDENETQESPKEVQTHLSLLTFEAPVGNSADKIEDFPRENTGELLTSLERRRSSFRLIESSLGDRENNVQSLAPAGSDSLMRSFNDKKDKKAAQGEILVMKTVAKPSEESENAENYLEADTMNVSSKGFFKQWCWRVPKSRVLLEVMSASGENRVGSVGVSETARDWVVPLLFFFTLVLFISIESKIADYRHYCITPCGGECDYEGNPTKDSFPDLYPDCKIPPSTFGQLHANEDVVEHIFEPRKFVNVDTGVMLSLIIRAAREDSFDHCKIVANATVEEPNGKVHFESLDMSRCDAVADSVCAVLLFHSAIGDREGYWKFTVTHTSCGSQIPLLAEAVVFYGNKDWFYVEVVVRYISIVLTVIGVIAIAVRLCRRMGVEEPHIATGRFVAGVTPFLLLMLNPVFLPSVIFGTDHWAYVAIDDLGPRWFLAAMASFTLSLIANTNLITDVPTLLDVRVHSLSSLMYRGDPDLTPGARVNVKLRRDPRYNVSTRDVYEAYSMCEKLINRLPIDDVVLFIKGNKKIQKMLHLSKSKGWEAALREECQDRIHLGRGFLAEIWKNVVSPKQMLLIQGFKKREKFKQDVHRAANYILNEMKEEPQVSLSPPSGISPRVITFLESGNLEQQKRVREIINRIKTHPSLPGQLQCDQVPDWAAKFERAFSDTDDIDENTFCEVWCKMSENKTIESVSDLVDEHLSKLKQNRKFRYEQMIDDVIKYIERDEQLRGLLNVDNLPDDWRNTFRKQCKYPECLSKKRFLQIWLSLNEIEKASPFITSRSQSWSIFQFAVDKLNLNRNDNITIGIQIEYEPMVPLRGTLLTPRMAPESTDQETHYKWITVSSTALRDTLRQEVLLPAPSFTTGNRLAVTADVAAVAALVLAVESFGPQIEVGVSGWLPAERDSSFSSLVRTPTIVCAVVVGIFLGISDLLVLSQRDWKLYLPGDFSGDREAVLFASTNTWAEDVRESLIVVWFVLMVSYSVHSGRNLERLGYRHARHQHLLFHMVRTVTLFLVIAAMIVFQFTKPTRHVENFRRRWDTMAFLGLGVPLYACFAVATCPPVVPRTLDPEDLNEQNYIAYLRDTGGSRLRFVRTIQEKEILLQAMQDAQIKEKKKPPASSFKEFKERFENSGEQAADILKDLCGEKDSLSTTGESEESETDEPQNNAPDHDTREHSLHHRSNLGLLKGDKHRKEMQQTFCIETAVNCFHCSTLAYETTDPFETKTCEEGCHKHNIEIKQDLQLSHDYPIAPKLLIDGRTRPSLYHYYYSQLLLHESPRDAKKVLQAATASEAKAAYHKLMDHRLSGDDVEAEGIRTSKKPICLPKAQKEALILKCLWAKYEQSAECRAVLLATGSRKLEDKKFDGLRTDHILSMIRRNSNDVLYISKELMEWRRELTSEKIITYSRKADEAIWAWVSEIDGRHEEMQHTVIEKLSASLFQLYQRDSEKKKRDRSYQSPLDKLKSNITNASERLNLFNSEVKIDPNMSYRLQKGVRHEEDAKLIVKLNTFEDIRRALFDETDVIFQDEVLTAIFSHCHKENISLCINSMISDVFGSGERGVYLKACESAKKNYAKLLQAASENTLLSLSEEYDISCSTFNVNSHHILSTLLKNVDSVGRAASKLRKFLEELTIRSLQLDCDIDALNMAERNGMLSTWDEVDKPRGTIVWRTLIEAMHLSTPPVPFSKVLLRTGRKTLVDSNYQSGHVIAPLGTGLHEVPEVTVHCSEEVTVTERYMEKVMRYAELEDVRVLFKEMLSLILEYQPADGIYQFDSEDEEHPSSQDEQPSPAGSYRTLSESRRSQGLLNNVDIFIRILEKCEREVIENRLALYVDGTGFKGQDSIFTQSEYDKWKQSKELLRKTTTKLVTQFEAAFREYIVDVTARSMKKQGTRKKLSLLEEWLHLYNNSYVDISDDIGETVYSILHKKLPVANSRTLLKLGNADLKGTAPSFDNVTEAFMMIREALQRRPKESKIAVEKKYGWLKKAGYSLVTKFTSKDGDTKRTLCRLSCSRYKAKTDNLDDENYPGQTTCWILKKGDSHYISFRGTILMQQGKTDLRNALTDITCCLTDMEVPGEGKVGVHKGFYKLWLNLREQIYRIMEENPEVKEIFYPKSSNNPLIFTGHSLGGALATLAALDFATDKSGRSDRNIIVYNFGCPRIGNAAFAQLCEKYVPESYRIINKGDMVPIMPPNFVWYQHAGHPVLLNSSGEFLVDSTFAERIILPYFQPSFFYRPHAHRRGGDGGNGYGNGIRRMAGNNNLRDMGELLYALRSGSKYSPEFRNLWTSQVSSSDPDEHHQAVFLKEAVSVCEEPPQVALSIPIVVYYCKLRSNTLVAASNQTRNWAIAHGYRQVCELGLVFTHPRGDGTSHSKKDLVPLYLYYNSKRRDHMLCATELECQNAEAKHYVRRSLEGYVFPATAETPSIATKAVTLTWRPKLQDHSILEANKFLPDSTNTIEVLHNQGFRILEKPRLSIVPKVWASLGYLPVCLFSGLLTVAIGEKRDAPLVAFITAIIIFSLGFALTMSVQIVRFPRSVDVAYIFSYGLLYVSTHHLNISLTDTDKLVVPLLVVTHSIAVLATVIGDHPFNEDNWQEDGTIPPGIAKKPEFVFIVRIYANTHLAASLLLSLIVFIPALMSRDELDSDYNEMFSAIGSICFFLLVHLYHHAMVFYCLKFLTTSAIGENIGATQARYRMSRYVHDFCQLFPEVPSIITGQFTIRDTDQSSELLHFPTGKQITHEVSTDNDEYYEEELGELLGFPAVLINAVATKSEGVDGRWGAEIRFNLVCRTNNEAVAMKNRMISLFSSGSRGRSKKNRGDVGQAHEKELERCNWFPHTMRSVKLVDFKTPSIESFQQFGLLDISFTRHGRYPPFHQPAKALQIAREMAMLLKVPTHNLQQVRRNHRNSNDKRSVKGQDPKELSSSLYKSSGDRLQSVTQFAGTVGGRGLGLGPRAESSIPLD